MPALAHPAVRVGLAVGCDRICAVPLSRRGIPIAGGAIWSRSLDGPDDGEGAGVWPGLRAALDELAEELHVNSGVAYVTLLPLLVQVRRIELPPLREHERRRMLARDAPRWFLTDRKPHVAAARPLAGVRAAQVPLLAAAAPAPVVDAIFDAAAHAGWRIASVVPAHASWLAAASTLWPALRGGPAYMAVIGEECVEVLRIERREVIAIRRLPVMSAGRDWNELFPALRGTMVTDAQRGTDRERDTAVEAVALAGADPHRERISQLLASCGVAVPAPARDAHLAEMPSALAAAFSARSRGPELLPERIHQARHRRTVRVTGAMMTAAALFLIMAAGLQLWGVKRELGVVLARRAALAAATTRTMATRDAIGALAARLSTLARLETTMPRWSSAIATVAKHLPHDAHLAAFRGSADSLVLEGVALHAAGVFASLRKTPGMAAVRAAAPIRQETRDGHAPVEHFELAAKLVNGPPDSASVASGVRP